MPESFDVAIVGGGPAGSGLAWLLREKGLDVALLDRKSGISSSKHSVALQPNGLAALSAMGVLDDVMKIGTRIDAVPFYDDRHQLLASVNMDELQHPFPFVLVVLPDQLNKVFLDRFVARGGSLVGGFELGTLLREGNVVKGVTGTLNGQALEVRAKVVVGADGPFSKIRDMSGLAYKINRYKDTQMVGVIPGELRGLPSRVTLAKGVMLGAASLSRGASTYLFCYMSVKEIERYKKAGIGELKKTMIGLDPDLQPSLESLNNWDQLQFHKAIGIFMKTWTLPGLTLVGDAAHAMDPWLAQGMNQSMLDLVSLAGVLDDCKKKNDFSYDALMRYERSRIDQAMFYMKQSGRASTLLVPRNRFYYWLTSRSVRQLSHSKRKRMFSLELSGGQRSKMGTRDIVAFLF